MTDDETKTWHKAFEMIGPETLRLRLEARRNEFSPEYTRAAEIWILEQEANKAALEARRYRKVLGWARIAGWAGIVGAVAAIVGIGVTIWVAKHEIFYPLD